MASDLHPYPLQQIDELTYLFVTDSGDEYKCYFISYGNYFADYPDIVSKIFGFNVAVVNPPNRNYGNDVRLAYTVIKIVASFLQSKINAVVYVCDPANEKGAARARKFNNWYHRFEQYARFVIQLTADVDAGGI
ncbi:MAG: hypothetical protein JNM68_05410, partial [Dinghuibacter sp.]|nr:hypothetical protein [Dinghuibacter sp.]